MSYSIEQFRADLSEPYAWPGGYPRFFITDDGESLSYAAARECQAEIESAIESGAGSGWCIVACDVNWEDPDLFCAHTGARIESAYAED